MAVETNLPRITVNDEQLTNADLAVERDLCVGVVAGALDLRQEIRSSHPVCSAINRLTVVQDHDHVGIAIVVLPARLPVTDVRSGKDFSLPRFIHHLIKDAGEAVNQS